jgi:hypothetical protein
LVGSASPSASFESLLVVVNSPENASLNALYLSPVVEIGCNIGVAVFDIEKLFSFNDAPSTELLVNGEESVFDIKGRILDEGGWVGGHVVTCRAEANSLKSSS